MRPSQSYLRREMETYLATVSDATKQEVAALKSWVQQGYSPYSNPFYLADERGREMSFIHALRAEQELCDPDTVKESN